MSEKKTTFLILLLLGAAYFVLFIFPNATGARDLNMTFIFNSDEPAQYPHALRMLTPGKTLAQSIYRFFAYQHYFYGFPYYFYAAVFALLPVKLLVGLENVSLNMLVLRQIVSVLPMIAALIILVYLQTGFESRTRSILLFLLLLLIPQVVFNDMWLHPESLVFLFIVLTLFFLVRDDLGFGRDFYLAALFCGLAVSTKLIGLFFFLAIPLYIFLGWRQKRIDAGKSLMVAALFVAIMLVTFVLTNPFLYWESERAFALKTQQGLHQSLQEGFIVAYHNSPWVWFQVIFSEYAAPVFLILSAAALLAGALQGERRLLNRLIMAWSVPFMIYISVALVIRSKHFPLPILLPVFSALPAYFTLASPSRFTRPVGEYLRTNGLRLFLLAVGVIGISWQFLYSLSLDVPRYRATLNREYDNPSLQFYSGLEQDYLSGLGLDRRLIVFRDVTMYVPDSPQYDVRFQWGIADYGDIQKIHADLLVLNKQHLRDYTQPGQLETASDPNFAQTYRFYQDALTGNVTGYTLLYQDDFGIAYLGTTLYDQFFASR
jgi:4-amino-4-deoxy-L-arabinose transferase-like glycosyltransferase